MAKIVEDRYIYETKAEHDDRMEVENHAFEHRKKRSRSVAKTRGVRRFINKRALAKCEICAFSFRPILVIHHIRPVRFGGSAQPRNLVLLCPNCHALVHNYNHFYRTSQRYYSAWLTALAGAGLTEEQGKRLLLIASKEALIHNDGSVEHYEHPSALISIIVDDDGNPIEPRHDPAVIEAALQRIEAKLGSDLEN